MTYRIRLIGVFLAIALPAVSAQERPSGPAKRNLTVDDLFRIRHVAGPQVSPDGKWVAYTVSTTNLKEDKSESQMWMVPAAGGEALPMTAKGTSACQPRFSPDGKYLAFLSARPASGTEEREAKAQVWLLDRRGGEAQQLTEVLQGVRAFEWSPYGTRLVLLVRDPSPQELEAGKQKEQGVQSLRQLGRTTQLVVYPGEHHGMRKPSYQKDLLERYPAWYDKYVKGIEKK